MAQKMGWARSPAADVSRTALNNERSIGLTASDATVVQNVRAMAPFRGTLASSTAPPSSRRYRQRL